MDNNVDTNNIDIDTININVAINDNDINDIDSDLKSIDTSNYEKKHVSMKKCFDSKWIEITCSWAHILHAHRFLTQTFWWDHQNFLKMLK